MLCSANRLQGMFSDTLDRWVWYKSSVITLSYKADKCISPIIPYPWTSVGFVLVVRPKQFEDVTLGLRWLSMCVFLSSIACCRHRVLPRSCRHISTNLFVWNTITICIIITGVSMSVPVSVLLTRVRNVDAVVLQRDVKEWDKQVHPSQQSCIMQINCTFWKKKKKIKFTFLQFASLHLSFSSGYPSMSVSFPHRYPLPAQPIPHWQDKWISENQIASICSSVYINGMHVQVVYKNA